MRALTLTRSHTTSLARSAGRAGAQAAHHSTTGKTNSIIRLIKTKNARWVSKSLSKSNEGAGGGCPITKYHRKLLSALWKGETNVTSIHVQLERQNLGRPGNLAQCAKGLVLILRLMQFGPPGCNFGELLEYVDGLMAAWATMQVRMRTSLRGAKRRAGWREMSYNWLVVRLEFFDFFFAVL